MPDNTISQQKLQSINAIAQSICSEMKSVAKLVHQLHSRRREMEEWDRALSTSSSLMQKQEQCIQILKEDQEVLRNVGKENEK